MRNKEKLIQLENYCKKLFIQYEGIKSDVKFIVENLRKLDNKLKELEKILGVEYIEETKTFKGYVKNI